MSHTQALRPGFALTLSTALFIATWAIVAAFPLLWIAVMSIKLPIDAFASDPLQVVFGSITRAERGGLSLVAIAIYVGTVCLAYGATARVAPTLSRSLGFAGTFVGWILTSVLLLATAAIVFFIVLPSIVPLIEAAVRALPLVSPLGRPLIGATMEHYRAVWIDHSFYHQFINSLIVTFGVVTISLTVGTLAGYALARAESNIGFWLLIAALIFRALPHSVLVTGYLPTFINSRQILMPLWTSEWTGWFFRMFSEAPPTLYGQPLAVIMVLVSINQPFTIWMLRSFFMNIPRELDEAARVDGCTYFEAFWRVIMPVMWPGVITTGLFAFLLAYNDFLVTSLLLDAQSQTMVPAIASFFNRETTTTDQVQAVAAAVSITAPLFVLVMVFQRQIVSGLTQGAVKG
ncbi:carbohydrate ABC transporter permease [Rhizobium sp. BK176]|uniref:carbohydrate ABC transporter permease n=1 Tax=Rhizobium sp. BK176 TaxID=2587071 RepID=UPI00216A34A4|nr:carbohydrate ABC transporter permease [Rhizobium sp. BK176]MCS4096210.1 multiple sugar transport system permease protein [Rhizobium sp. BK176]